MFLSLEQLIFFKYQKRKNSTHGRPATVCHLQHVKSISTSAVHMKMFLESGSKVKSLDENSHPVELLAPL